MNYLIKVKKILPSHTGRHGKQNQIPKTIKKEDVGDTESVDSFSIQLFTIGIIYLATYLVL